MAVDIPMLPAFFLFPVNNTSYKKRKKQYKNLHTCRGRISGLSLSMVSITSAGILKSERKNEGCHSLGN